MPLESPHESLRGHCVKLEKKSQDGISIYQGEFDTGNGPAQEIVAGPRTGGVGPFKPSVARDGVTGFLCLITATEKKSTHYYNS